MKRLSLFFKLFTLAVKHPVTSLRQLNLQNIRKLKKILARRNADDAYDLIAIGVRSMGYPLGKKALEMERSYPGITEPIAIGKAFALEQKLKVPAYEVISNAKTLINVLLPHLDPNIIFGGYISCLELIRKLVARGYSVRILLCETTSHDRERVLQKFDSNPQIRDALSKCTIENIAYGQQTTIISPQDAFIAYSAWTGLIAHEFASAIGKKFIFFLQEHESIFHPYESERAIIDSVYDLPHYAMFNTSILQDYFRRKELGVYAPHQIDPAEESSLAFQHALTKTSAPTIEQLKVRKKKRLLFYGRPENHARRNLFEIAFLGLRKAVATGVFDDEWEFVGVGTLAREYNLPLGDSHVLKLMGKLPLGDYAEALKTFDLGLSLMYAPHPSILPFEMASSGIVTVTNTFDGRGRELLTNISPNLIPCAPTIDGVANALIEAVKNRVGEHDDRIRGSSLDWVMDWDSAFNDAVMTKVEKYINE